MKDAVQLRSVIPLGLFLFLGLAPAVFAARIPVYTGQVQNRLTEAKLRACQAREDSIKKRMEQLVKLATTMQEKFSAIEGRVETYYTAKVIPSGKTVASYDSLVADIQTKKGLVQTALVQAQTDGASFSCDGSDPKGHLTQFRTDMRAVKDALKNFRTSIKNLIVAVRSVSSTPTPTGI